MDAPRLAGVVVAGVNEGGDAWDEKNYIKHKVKRSLHARPHRAVEEVAAYVGILRQGVGPPEHEQRAVQHVLGIEDPSRRRVHDVAFEDLDADDRHQGDDQPGRELADPSADAVDHMQKALDSHGDRRWQKGAWTMQSTTRYVPNGALPVLTYP
jgi:hypothetical protein